MKTGLRHGYLGTARRKGRTTDIPNLLLPRHTSTLHAVGDQALQETVRVTAAELREGDVLARFGGEEFLVLLPMTGLDAARLLAERLRKALASIVLSAGSDEVRVGASFGVAELGSGESVAGWLGRADRALYQAKERGRDCVVAAD